MDETQAKAALGSALCDLVRAQVARANAVAFPPERRFQIALACGLLEAAEGKDPSTATALRAAADRLANDAIRAAFEALWRDVAGLPQPGTQA